MQRVSQIEGVEIPKAVHHARVVVEMLSEAISPARSMIFVLNFRQTIIHYLRQEAKDKCALILKN